MAAIIFVYTIALLISVAGLSGGLLFYKKALKTKVHLTAFFVGIIDAVFLFTALVMLFQMTFSTIAYYNTPFFRTMVGLVFLCLFSLLRFFVRKSFFDGYKDRHTKTALAVFGSIPFGMAVLLGLLMIAQKQFMIPLILCLLGIVHFFLVRFGLSWGAIKEQGQSFSLGFGMAPILFIGFYLLIMALVLIGNSLFNGPAIINDGFISFADNTIISIFQPVGGHLSFAGALLFYGVVVVAFDRFADQITFGSYRLWVSIVWCILLALLEGLMILPIPFIKMYGLEHWHLPIIAGVVAVAASLLVWLMPKKKELNTTYTKQFE